MQDIFLTILDMSMVASIVIAVVLLARILLGKVPKRFSYLLWAAVLFRLLCPFSIESAISLIPEHAKSIPQKIALDEYERVSPASAAMAAYHAIGDAVNGGLGVIDVRLEPDEGINTDLAYAYHRQIWLIFFAYLWPVGLAALLIYSIISLIKLRQKLVGSVRLRENIYLADHIVTPFVIGVIRPKIYLPSTLSERERDYTILHEQTHIRRLDHIVKLAAFLALILHWFNPLVWAAFILSGRDMEMSCDEAVMKKMDGDIRADYSASLLSLATGRKIFAGAPLAFGEGDTKSRIKNVMNYKKPAFGVLIVCLVTVIALSILLMLNPKQSSNNLIGATYQVGEVLYTDIRYSFTYTGETAPLYSITADYAIYEKENTPDAEWIQIGNLYPVEYSREELYAFFNPLYNKPHEQLDKVRTIYRADKGSENQTFYLVMQTDSGEILIALGYGASESGHIRWLYRVKQISETYDDNYIDMSIESYLNNTTDVESFSAYQTDTGVSYVIVGFLSDGDTAKSDMGFATFRFKDGRYLLIDCNIYSDAAIIDMPSIVDSTIHNGVHPAEDLAVCYQYGKPSEDVAYEIILSSNPTLSSITRNVNGVQESIESVTGNPSMTAFRRSNMDAEHEITYQFSYD